MHPPRRHALVAGALAVVAALAGCATSSGAAAPSATSTASVQAARYSTPLAGVCPSTVKIQLPWWPESDYGWAFQLIGSAGTVDSGAYTYTGPLGSTGVQLQIRSGGPATGGQLALAQLYQDDSILLGITTTEDSISGSQKQPSVAVFTYQQKTPLVFFWGNDSWDFKSLADIKASGKTVLAFGGSTYLDVLTSQGLLSPGQVDGSYKGDPARFVAEDGNIVQQGIITQEIYSYQHDLPQWGKPVKYIKLGDEYKAYHSQVSIRADKLDANRACLSKLVPLLQQAAVDYWTSPAATNQVLLDVVKKFGSSWTLTAGVNDWASTVAVKEGIVANGTDGTFGSFDQARVTAFIDQVAPVLSAKGAGVKPGLTAQDIVTNEFLDPKIKL